ncbi:hypothetical protein RhiLY_08555 [Ceratobasidium sp. AG-Ba]|nr:hypothetical protein RhiLY_08555 [Ceratobasidium sp. AG-Ba]
MSQKSNPLPFDMEKVWGTCKCRNEDYVLDTELQGRIASGQARIRYLTDFIFVKDGKIVFPVYERCTPEFWKGVQVYGFMIGPTSSIDRWYIWSLHWWLAKQQVELVRIDNVIGIEKQNDLRYRNGNEQVLWLNSRKGYAYALMEPDESIAQGWRFVNASWKKEGRDGLPVCVPADPDLAPPDWWHNKGEVTGRAAWQALQRAWEKKKEEEEEAEDEEEAEGEDDSEEKPAPKNLQKRKMENEEDAGSGKRRKSSATTDKGKTKEHANAVAKPPTKAAAKPPTKGKAHQSTTSGSGSKKSLTDSPTARLSKRESSSKTRAAKRPAAELSEQEEIYIPPSGKPPPSPPTIPEASTLPASPFAEQSSSSAIGIVPPTSKQACAFSLGHIVESAPDVSGRKEPMLREAKSRYTHGPATQEVNQLPSLEALVNSPSGTVGAETLGDTQGSAVDGVARLSMDPVDKTSAPQAAASGGAAAAMEVLSNTLQATSQSQSLQETGAFNVLLAKRAEDYTPKTKRLDTLHRAVIDASTLDYIYEQPQEAATHQARIRRRRRRIQNRKSQSAQGEPLVPPVDNPDRPSVARSDNATSLSALREQVLQMTTEATDAIHARVSIPGSYADPDETIQAEPTIIVGEGNPNESTATAADIVGGRSIPRTTVESVSDPEESRLSEDIGRTPDTTEPVATQENSTNDRT